MLVKNMFAIAAFVASAIAAVTPRNEGDYHCQTNKGKFNIKKKWAQEAFESGGTTTGKSGFPHAFGGGSGSNAQLKFYGADMRCNENNPKLLEYPVMKNGHAYKKDDKHDHTETPARVVYLQDGKTLCGVMTHVIEKDDHHGEGDFRVCDN